MVDLSFVGSLPDTLISPFWGSDWSFTLIVVQPILFWVVERVDHFGDQFILLSNLKHSSSILVAAAVVSGREDGEELTSCESFKSIHYTLVRSQNKFNFVIIQEKFYSIWAKFHDVSCAVRVSNKVGLDTKLGIAISRV